MSKLVLAGAALLVTSVSLAAKPVPPPVVVTQTAQAEDPDKPLFLRMCSDCHDADRIVGSRRSKTEWEEVLNKMIEKGALGSEAEFLKVMGFLFRNYGKVAVNKASATDLAEVLSVSTKDAEAIVAYRKDHGDFANFEALCKVPGVDTKALELHKDALQF
jgi:competence protein ComEA